MKIRIFTDGACSSNPGPGGWAAVFNTDKGCFVLKGYEFNTTNNRMELQAVVGSIKKVLLLSAFSNDKNLCIEIYSDSAYVVNAINKGWVNKWQTNGWITTGQDEVKNKDLWSKFLLYKMQCDDRKVPISFIKIKGHSGNTFNEMADRVAKDEVLNAKAEMEALNEKYAWLDS